MLTIDHRVTLGPENLTVHAEMNNLGVLALNKFLRSIPSNQRDFFKDCRVVAVIPAYLPTGDFKENECAIRMDKDQINWFLREHPEFKAVDETANNHLSTGGKIVSVGGIDNG